MKHLSVARNYNTRILCLNFMIKSLYSLLLSKSSSWYYSNPNKQELNRSETSCNKDERCKGNLLSLELVVKTAKILTIQMTKQHVWGPIHQS
jgi:hypothetical protein